MTENDKAVQEILKVVMFENWLRFYFIEAENNDETRLVIKIPAQAMQKIGQLFPRYLVLAESMNKQLVDFNTSRAAVLTFVAEKLEGVEFPQGLAVKVMDSRDFQIKLQMFNLWVQLHEEQLDNGFLDFGAWLKLFNEWQKTEGAKKLESTLKESEINI